MTLTHSRLFYVEPGRLHMGIPAERAASRFGETAPLFKDEAAGDAAAGDFKEFLSLAPHRALDVNQVVDSLLFRDTDTLGNIAQGCLFGPKQVDDLLSYRPFIVGRHHVPPSLLYSSTQVEPSSPFTSKHLPSGVSHRFTMAVTSTLRPLT
jgi:hypothetical protein